LLFLGLFAVVVFAYGLTDETQFVASICVRVGLVLCAIWLAYPQLEKITQRVPPWMLGCIVLGMLIIIVRPRMVIYLAPVLAAIAVLQFVGWLFKPLPQQKRSKRSQQPPRRDSGS
jgi:hypothetical protein